MVTPGRLSRAKLNAAKPFELDDVDATGEQQRVEVDLRPALADLDLDAVLAIDAGRGRLEDAAGLGLRAPGRVVDELVERLG